MFPIFSFILIITQMIVFIDKIGKQLSNRCIDYNISSRLNGLACLRMFIFKTFILTRRDIGKVTWDLSKVGWLTSHVNLF